MKKEVNEHYLKKELYELIKTDSSFFNFIQEGSLDGLWYWNLEKIEDEWLSSRFWEVLGYDPKKKKHSSREWRDIIFKDDLIEATKNFEKHLQDPKYPYDQTVRYKHKDGSTVWIRCRGLAIRDEHGKAIRMLGAHTNITELQNQIIDLNHLTEITEQLLTTIGEGLDYQKITDHLLKISKAKFVAFNLYDKEGTHFITKAYSGSKDSIRKAMDIMGMKLDKKKWNHDFVRADKIKDKIVTHFPTLHDLVGDVIPKSLCTLLTKSFNLGETILIKIMKDQVMLGDFTLLMQKGDFFDKDSIVEIYANQIGLAIVNAWANDKLKESEQRFRVTLQSLDDGVVIHAPDSSIIDSNERALDILGLSKNEILGKTASDTVWKFVDENEKPLLLEDYPVNKILTSHKQINNLIIGIVSRADKEIVWTQVKGIPIFDHEGHIKEVVISFFDITHLRNTNKKLTESEQEFRLLTTQMPIGLALHEIICDDSGKPVDYRFISVNESYEILTGLKGKDIVGKTIREVLPGVEKYWIEAFGQVALTGKSIQYENYSKELSKYFNTSSYSPKKGQFAVLVEDITQRIKDEQELEFLATHDVLTGLTNRAFFSKEIVQIDKPENLPISVVCFDINGLVILNEAYGYEHGNEYINIVAQFLRECFNEEDAISRVSGDEFALILKNTTNDQAKMKALMLVEKVNAYTYKDVEMSIAFGMATKTKSEDVSKLLLLAENDMLSNKLFDSQSHRNQSITSIIKAYNEKNPREEEHTKRVSDISVKFGQKLGMSNDDINKLKATSHLHDIGKIAIDEAILNKKGKLNDEEWAIIKKHPEIGARIMLSSNEYTFIADDILAHHERWDGKGYPHGLSGENIPIRARIISIVDSYDAMISDRPYRNAMTHKEAIEEIIRCSNTQFDPELVKIFISLFENEQ